MTTATATLGLSARVSEYQEWLTPVSFSAVRSCRRTARMPAARRTRRSRFRRDRSRPPSARPAAHRGSPRGGRSSAPWGPPGYGAGRSHQPVARGAGATPICGSPWFALVRQAPRYFNPPKRLGDSFSETPASPHSPRRRRPHDRYKLSRVYGFIPGGHRTAVAATELTGSSRRFDPLSPAKGSTHGPARARSRKHFAIP